jgi:hypothetical protein
MILTFYKGSNMFLQLMTLKNDYVKAYLAGQFHIENHSPLNLFLRLEISMSEEGNIVFQKKYELSSLIMKIF